MSATDTNQPETKTPDVEPDFTPPENPGLNPEPDDEPEAAPEPVQPPAQPPTPEQMEKRFSAAERELGKYARKILEIYGEQASDLIECPLCPGIHKGFVNGQDAGLVPPDIANACMAFLGFARERQYRQSSRYQTCPACDGEGKVYTGSHVPNKETIRCDDCDGGGFIPPMRGASARNGHTDAPAFDLEGDPLVAEPAEKDAWGEPRILPDGRENPNYGKMPQFKVPVEPWGVTAGLTVQDAA